MALNLDELPYVCLWHICSFLPPESLSRCSRVNRIFNDVCSSEELWKSHSLSRWQFCNISQISDGPNKWQRYFRARRSVESRIDTGRPTLDYRVKSLRGHETDIINAICLNESEDDLENPRPPLVISLSMDHVLYAWDVTEAKKPVWSLEDKQVTCIAGGNGCIAVGDSDGHVTVFSVSDWSESAKFAPPTPDRTVKSVEFTTITANKNDHHCLLICYMLFDDSGEILIIEKDKMIITLAASTACSTMSIKGTWLAAAQDRSSSEVFVWNLSDVLIESMKSSDQSSSSPASTTPPQLTPHMTLHLNNSCSSMIWLNLGTLATFSTTVGQQYHNPFFPPVPAQPLLNVRPAPQNPPPPGQVHILPFPGPGIPPVMLPQLPNPSSDLEVWEVSKHIESTKKRSNLVYNVKHMYDSKVVKLSCIPHTVAFTNGVAVVGEQSGQVRVVDLKDGKCLQEFSAHKAAVTDIYADSYRVLTCSSDFSIRVYRWNKEITVGASEGGKPPKTTCSYKLESRYQLLGGSVAFKTHDGFNRILCQSGSCVGVAGNVLKLYYFTHQLQQE